MWFHLEPKGAGYSGALSGIAVSDKVAGPYKFLRAVRPNAGSWPTNVQDIHKQAIPVSDKKASLPAVVCRLTDSLNLLGRDMEGGQMARDMNLFC